VAAGSFDPESLAESFVEDSFVPDSLAAAFVSVEDASLLAESLDSPSLFLDLSALRA